MAAKHLSLPPLPSTVLTFPLSNAPLTTPAGWWHRPSSLPSSLAKDEDNGSNVHRCSSCHVVVMLLSCWLSCLLSCCCCPSSRVIVITTAAAATANPPMCSGRRHHRSHLHRRCCRNRICCSYHHHPHLAVAFTAIADATNIAPADTSKTQIPSTQLLLAVAITVATAAITAIAVAFAAAITATNALASAVTIAAACTDVSASACLALPDAGACGDNSPKPWSSRHGREVWR